MDGSTSPVALATNKSADSTTDLKTLANRQVLATRNAYPHVSIGGNAQVHLGDQYLRHLNEDEPSNTTRRRKGFDHLDVAAHVLAFIDFATRLTAVPGTATDRTPVATFGKPEIVLATGTLDSLCTILHRIQDEGLENPDGPGSDVAVAAAMKAVHLADELRFALQDLKESATKEDYPSLQHAVVGFWKSGDLQEAHTALLEAAMYAMLGYLISRRPIPGQPPRKRMAFKGFVERFVAFIVDQVLESHYREMQELCEVLSPGWLGYRTPMALKSAAEDWLHGHETLVRNLTSWILSEIAIEHDLRFRWQLLDFLSFEEINLRYEGISPAQRQTYEWLFNRHSQEVGYSFAKWLQNPSPDNKVYWVSGKPGSGKSTLMRFLSDDPRTLGLSGRWSADRPILLTRCFFWEPGTRNQKSQIGLLQTILHQLLKQHTAIPGHSLFPNRWQSLELGGVANYPWTLQELRVAIFACLQLATVSRNIYVFVDGLDEYSGTDEERIEVCNLLQAMATSPRVKICASSRPWNVYRDAFAQCPSLRLEDLNREDIRTFVTYELTKGRFSRPLTEVEADQNIRSLVETIVDRAKGVFLWARLVVRSLSRGLRDGDDTHELTMRLDDIPADLEEYFHQMLMKLKPEYREQASQIFRVALMGAQPLMFYYFIHKAQRDVNFDVKGLSFEEVRVRESLWDRRVNARCMDLLETTATSTRSLRVVDFMHRTARDFVAASETQQLLSSWRHDSVSHDLVRLKAYTAMLQSCDVNRAWLSHSKQTECFNSIVRLAASLNDQQEAVNSILKPAHSHLDDLLVELSKSTGMLTSKQYANDFLLTPEIPDFLSLALTERLDSYALSVLSGWSKAQLQARTGHPLLDCALMQSETNHTYPLPLASVARLLELGADPNAFWRGVSVFGHFLWRLNSGELRAPADQCFAAAEMLIVYGAVCGLDQNERLYDGSQRREGKLPEPTKVFAQRFSPTQQKSLRELLEWSRSKQRKEIPPGKRVAIHLNEIALQPPSDATLKRPPKTRAAAMTKTQPAPALVQQDASGSTIDQPAEKEARDGNHGAPYRSHRRSWREILCCG